METSAIITGEEVKSWVRIDNDAEDAAIALLILTAQEQAAAYTGLTLDPETCPSSITKAIAIFVADLYAYRDGQTVGVATFHRLLNPYRIRGL